MRVKDMPRNQQKAVFAQMVDTNYLNRLESAEHAHARLEYLRKRHDLAETAEDKIWDVWNSSKLTHTQKMAKIRMIKLDAAEKLKKYQTVETEPTVAGQIKKEKWSQFQKKKYSLEAVPDNPVTESTTFERGSQARAERDVIARNLEKHKDAIKEPYAVATNMVKSGAKAEDREAVAKELKEQKMFADRFEKEKIRHAQMPHKLSPEYTLPAARKFKEQPSGFWHRKGEMRTLTHSEMAEQQRFEHNISQFPEYKELRRRGADHDYAVSKTMDKRNIKLKKKTI